MVLFSCKIWCSIVAIVGIAILWKWLSLSKFEKSSVDSRTVGYEEIFAAEQLALYNGVDEDRLYLAILGQVFDVTAGRRHYEPGATYHVFIGTDRSRSFVSGEFSADAKQQQHVLDLTCPELVALQNWLDTYHRKYTYRGKLAGLYYDAAGRETEESVALRSRLELCERQDSTTPVPEHPPCNMEWSADTGSRVWCTRNSGGVRRERAGVPRQAWSAGESAPRCVCAVETAPGLQPYPRCAAEAHECFLTDTVT